MSLSSDISHLRREMGKEFDKFRRIYFKDYHKVQDAPFHGLLERQLMKMKTRRGRKFGLAAPRGSAKSTIVTLEYVLYSVVYGSERYIVIISNTANQATNLLTDIKYELENNPLLIEDFPEVCEIGEKPGPPRWRDNEIITRNGIKVSALGSGQQFRGRKNRQDRPTLIIGDDVEPGENTNSPDRSLKLYTWFLKSVLKMGNAETNYILIGTIHNYQSLLSKFLNRELHPDWRGGVVRAVEVWSDHSGWTNWTRIYHRQETYNDETGPRAALKFFEANKEAMLEGTKVFWPDQSSYYDLMVCREENYNSFSSEYQNEPVNPEDCDFNMDEATYWDDHYKTLDELLRKIGRNVEFYGACDPSLGKENKRGDFSAIIVIARDPKNGTMYIIDADIKRRSPDHTINDILAYSKVRGFNRFGFEGNQFQCLMEDELRNRSNILGQYIPIESIINTGKKRARILSLQPFIKSGALQFCRRHLVLLEQMKMFPLGRHDDGVDALEIAARICKASKQNEPKITAVFVRKLG